MPASQTILPGVPLIESPLFEVELARADLGEEERDIALRLNRDGFAIIDFPDPDIHARIDRIISRLSARFGLPEDSAERPEIHGGMRVQDAWHFDEDVRAIAANPAITDLLTKLYGRQAFPFQTLNFPIGTEQALHTDTVHFSSVPERFMCGVWLAMEDVGPESGPLSYVPGSHKWPVMSNCLIGRKGWGTALESAQHPFENAWSALVEVTGLRPETLLARKGQALIWCANLLHGGSRRLDPRQTRWSQVTHYYFQDCVYYTPAFSDEPLGRLQLRRIVNAADGTEVPNRYLGEIIASTPPGSTPRRLRSRIRNAWSMLLARQ